MKINALALGFGWLLVVPILGAAVGEVPPVGVGVRIWAKAISEIPEQDPAYLQLNGPGTFLATVPGGNPASENLPGNLSTATESGVTLVSDMGIRRVEPGKTYEMSVDGANFNEGEINLEAPLGYEVIIDNIERTRLTINGSSYVVFGVRPVRARHPGLAGMATSVSSMEIDWRMSLGSLRNGGSAGDISFVDIGPSSAADWTPLFTPARLYFEPTSAEIAVYRPSNVLRQILANQVAVDIVTLSSTSYEIRCYHPSQVVGTTFPCSFTGVPYVAYRIAKGATATSLEFQREVRDVTSATGDFPVTRRELMTLQRTGSWPAVTWTKSDWTLEGQTPLTETVVVSGGTQSNRTEAISIRAPGTSTNAVSVARNYALAPAMNGFSQYENLASETQGSTNGMSTSLTYYTTTYDAGYYGKLKSAVLPGGKWLAYEYYPTSTSGARGGGVKYQYRPFVNAPETVTLNSTLGEVTYHEYTDDFFGAPTRPTLVRTLVNNVVAGRTTFAYNDNHSVVGGQTVAQVTRTEYVADTQSLATVTRYFRPDSTDPLVVNQVRSITAPGGLKQSFHYGAYYYGSSEPDNGWGSAVYAIQGSSDPAAGTANPATPSATLDTVYLVDGKSTMEVTIRGKRALVNRTESHVWRAGAWQLVAWTNFVYDFAGRLTSRVSSNGATYTATYSGGLKTSETDEAGVTTNFAYDQHARVLTTTRVASGGIGELVTRYTYDAAGRVTKEEVGYGQAGVMVTQRAFDDAGRTTTVTPPGNYGVTTYTYDVANRSQTATRADGGTVITTESRDGRALSVTGTGTVSSHYSYGVEADGRRWQQVNTGAANSARWSKVWRDWAGREVKSEHPGFTGQLSVVTENLFSASTGRLVKTTKTGFKPTLYEYNSLGQVSRSGLDVDDDGVLSLASNDRITESDSYLEAYAGTWWMTQVTRIYPKLGLNTVILTSTSRTRATGHPVDRLSETESTDAEGNVTRQWVTVNRNARTSTATTTRTGLAGSLVEQTVNGFSTSVTSFDGLTVTKAYDSLLRPSTVTDSRGNTTTTTYVTGTALAQTVTNAAGNQVVTTYNTLGQIVTQRDARNHRTRFAYNLRGQLTQQWGDGAMPVEYGYDSTYGDRISMKTYRGGTGWDTTAGDGSNTSNPWPASPGTADTTTWTYDAPSGLLTGKTDALGRTAGQTYNLRGQTAVRTLARGVTTTFGYDAATGELLSQTYSDGTPAVSFTYGRTGQVETVTDTTGTRDLVYDPAKPWRLTAEAHADFYGSLVLTRLYDETGTIGRVRGFQLGATAGSNSDLEQTFGFTTVGRFETLTSNRLGNTAAARTFRYSYLANTALLQSLAIDQGAGPGSHPFTITRAYESQRDLVQALDSKWSTDLRTGYSYVSDERGLRTNVVQSGSVFADYGDVTAQQFTYNGRGELTGAIGYLGSDITLPAKQLPGRRHEYAYDPAGNRQWSNRTGVTALRDDYTTNALNQYVSRENNTVPVSGTAEPDPGGPGGVAVAVAGGATAPVPAGRQGRYWNDEVAVTNAAGPWRGPLAIYAVKRSTGSGDLFKVESRMAEIAAVLQSFAYDLDGNLTSDGLVDYTWDAENRLVRMETSLAARGAGFPHRELTFRYDYLGRRVQKRVVDVTQSQELSCRRFLYDGWNLIAEYAAPGGTTCGTLLRSYTWGLDIVNTLSSAGGVGALLQIADHPTGKTFLPTYDGNGNVVALVNATSGAVAAAYEYSPFGEPLRAQTLDPVVADNPFRFSTKYTDGETGLVYYGHRYYDPKNGRFINRDPIEETGGLNLYGFCGNDGVNRWDYLGMADLSSYVTDLDAFIGQVTPFLSSGGTFIATANSGLTQWHPSNDPSDFMEDPGDPIIDYFSASEVQAFLAGAGSTTPSGAGSTSGPGTTPPATSTPPNSTILGSDLDLMSLSGNVLTTPSTTGATLVNSGIGSLTFVGSDPTFCGPVASATTGNTVTLILGILDLSGPISTSGGVNSSGFSTVDAGTRTAPPSAGAGASNSAGTDYASLKEVGYVIAGGSVTAHGGTGHFFSGTVSPTGQVTVLDYGANGVDTASGNLRAVVSANAHAVVMPGITNVNELNAWAGRNGYQVYATPVGPADVNAANRAINTIVNQMPTYSVIGGSTCVTVNLSVLSSTSVQTPLQTWSSIPSYYGAERPVFMGTPGEALLYLSATPGWQPSGVYLGGGGGPGP